jgi:hypothetical protein
VLSEALRNFNLCNWSDDSEAESEKRENWVTTITYVLELLDALLFNEPDILNEAKSSDLALLTKTLTKVILSNFLTYKSFLFYVRQLVNVTSSYRGET